MARLRIHVVPNAHIEMAVGEHGGAIKIKLRAPAVEGKANEECIRFFAELLGVPRWNVTIVQGSTSRMKVIEIEGLAQEQLEARLRGRGGP